LIYNYNLLGKYKEDVLSQLLNNENINNLLLDGEANQDLMYNQVFPCFCNPDLTNESKTFLMVDGFIREETNTVQKMVIDIKYFTNYAKIQYSLDGFYGTRLDILTTLIDGVMTQPNLFGIGRFNSGDRQIIYPTDDGKWLGYVLQYTVPDFNKNVQEFSHLYR